MEERKIDMATPFHPQSAYIACNGGDLHTCAACEFGCIGCGACVQVCPNHAIEMTDGLPHIDPAKCDACAMCVQACARDIIRICDSDKPIRVRCSSTYNADYAKMICQSSCIGCGACVKACPAGAIKVAANLAYIKYRDCLSCGKCITACPRGVLEDLRGIIKK